MSAVNPQRIKAEVFMRRMQKVTRWKVTGGEINVMPKISEQRESCRNCLVPNGSTS
jgi:hypothetical protein